MPGGGDVQEEEMIEGEDLLEMVEKRIRKARKQTVCTMLAETLKATDQASDVVTITYQEDDDLWTARILFRNGVSRMVNVSLDSDTAMIRDIMAHI